MNGTALKVPTTNNFLITILKNEKTSNSIFVFLLQIPTFFKTY